MRWPQREASCCILTLWHRFTSRRWFAGISLSLSYLVSVSMIWVRAFFFIWCLVFVLSDKGYNYQSWVGKRLPIWDTCVGQSAFRWHRGLFRHTTLFHWSLRSSIIKHSGGFSLWYGWKYKMKLFWGSFCLEGLRMKCICFSLVKFYNLQGRQVPNFFELWFSWDLCFFAEVCDQPLLS